MGVCHELFRMVLLIVPPLICFLRIFLRAILERRVSPVLIISQGTKKRINLGMVRLKVGLMDRKRR